MVVDPKTISTKDLHQYLLGAVSPRPIAFVSTVDKEGIPNLAPYSFFNCFSSNPPILVFSSNRRVEDNTTKDTLANIKDTMECVVNVVSHSIVRQMTICSVEFPKEVDEFEKAGLTPLPSDLVKAFRIKESPVNMECRVENIIPLGENGGAGHLIICHVIRMHIHDEVLDENGRIDPHKIDLMGRMGRFYYVRASGQAIHSIIQPFKPLVQGFDFLPLAVRNSHILTGNDLAELAALVDFPSREEIESTFESDSNIQNALNSKNAEIALHQYAKELIGKKEVALAARVLKLGSPQ